MLVEAGLGGQAARLGIAIAGQREESHRSPKPLPDTPRHLVTIYLGQPDIDQRDRGRPFRCEADGLVTLGGLLHLMSVELENLPQHLARVPIVVYDEDAPGGRPRSR